VKRRDEISSAKATSILLLLCASAAYPQDDPITSVTVNELRVDALVTDSRGHAVGNLQADGDTVTEIYTGKADAIHGGALSGHHTIAIASACPTFRGHRGITASLCSSTSRSQEAIVLSRST